MTDATRTCAVCDNPLPRYKRKFCSEVCFVANRNAIQLAAHNARKADPKYLAARKRYAAVSYQRRASRPEAVARQRRMTAQWRERNAEKVAASHRAWRQANADAVRAKNQRRRSRLLASFVEDVDPAVIYRRDCGICGICGRRVDLAIAWPDRMSKTLDHIVPLAQGGTHEYANVQLAHAVCNSRKNDRVL